MGGAMPTQHALGYPPKSTSHSDTPPGPFLGPPGIGLSGLLPRPSVLSGLYKVYLESLWEKSGSTFDSYTYYNDFGSKPDFQPGSVWIVVGFRGHGNSKKEIRRSAGVESRHLFPISLFLRWGSPGPYFSVLRV